VRSLLFARTETARVERTLLSVAFDVDFGFDFDLNRCHSELARSGGEEPAVCFGTGPDCPVISEPG
jgi:hypothetical protein